MIETYPMAVITAPGKVEFVERRLPPLGEFDLLIRVRAAAICGSDLHIYRDAHPAVSLPVTIGHELSGEVIAVGERVSRVQPGDRVAVEPVLVCGKCYFCRRGQYQRCVEISFQYRQGQGGFTTHFVSHENWVHRLPDNISYEEGALLEPLSVALHAVKISELRMGESAVIFGDGPIGLLILMVALLAGAEKVFVAGAREYRLEKALQLGASRGINNFKEDALKIIFDQTAQLGVDRSFEAAGRETTLVQSLQVLKKGGVATLVGLFEDSEIRIPANLFVQREIALTGSQGYNWDFQTAIDLVSQKKLDLKRLITHILPLASLAEGFELVINPDAKATKVLMANE